MKYCIIGAGISGLSAAYFIRKKYPDARITIIEKSGQPGGLGSWTEIDGFYIEPYYHHFFESDKYIKDFAKEFKIDDKLFFKTAKSAYFFDDGVIKLSGPVDLLFFKKLTFIERLRVIFSMVYLKLLPDGTSLDKFTVKEWMERWIGKRAYSVLWQTLMKGKFEKYADEISMSWMWGRIHDRTVKLGYFTGGIRVFFKTLEKWLLNNDIEIQYNTTVTNVEKRNGNFVVTTDKASTVYDKLIFTTISPIFAKITAKLFDADYLKRLTEIKHIGTVCLLLELKNKVQENYWINMCSKQTPYLISIEHTNFADPAEYKNKTIFYLAKYSDPVDDFYKQENEYYLSEGIKAIQLLNSNFKQADILEYKLAKVPASQTIFTKGYVKMKPAIATPDENIFLINIDQTFPHDRNLNMGIYLTKDLMKLL